MVPASGLLITYFLRFIAKAQKSSIDFFKWLGIALLSIWPLCFYYFESPGLNDILYVLSYLTVPVLGVTYLYDRWLLKPETMKKKHLMILVTQTVLIFLMLIYSLFQKTAADKAREEALRMKDKADELAQENRELQEKLSSHQQNP
jgi:hypothetical protein